MTIEVPPPFRVKTTQTHLSRARDYRDPNTIAEIFTDALLTGLAKAVDMRAEAPTKASIAAAVEAAEQAAKLTAETAVCACGHRWTGHVGRAGCMTEGGCECREQPPARDVSWTPQKLPTPAEVARAYDDEDSHFPQAGAR